MYIPFPCFSEVSSLSLNSYNPNQKGDIRKSYVAFLIGYLAEIYVRGQAPGAWHVQI